MPWFGRKRFGWGLQPTSWQGWLLTVAYVAFVITLGVTVASSQAWIFATLFVAATVLYLVVAFLTKE